MADYYGTDTVVSELREDGLLIIRINRPNMANALNGATSKAMENIMNNAETDPAVRAIIVTGTGKVFCAGEDLSELSEGGECQTVTEHGFGGLTARTCSKPVIAACNGSAAGGGMEIALSCDMVVASERAKFGCTGLVWASSHLPAVSFASLATLTARTAWSSCSPARRSRPTKLRSLA